MVVGASTTGSSLVLLIILVHVALGEIYRVPVEWKTLSFNTTSTQLPSGLLGEGVLAASHDDDDVEYGMLDLMAPRKKKGTHTKAAKVKLKTTADYLVGSITVGVPKKTKLTQVVQKIKNIRRKPYKVVLDTGSCQTWVFSYEAMGVVAMRDSMKHHFHKTYGSKNLEITQTHFDAYYANGAHYSGKVASDTFNIGGASAIGGFGLVKKINPIGIQVGTELDGYFGLALDEDPDIDPSVMSPFYNMMDQNKFSNKMFSVYFSPDGTKGEFVFGGMDTKLFVPDTLQRVSLSSDKGRWQVEVQEFRLGGDTALLFPNVQAEIDTSSKAIFVPKGGIEQLFNAFIFGVNTGLENNDFRTINVGKTVERGSLVLDCNKRDLLPPLEFVISGIEGLDVVYSLEGDEYFPKVGEGEYENCKCVVEETAFEEEEVPMVSLGLPFLKKYYTVFHAGMKEMGFAVSKASAARSGESGRTKNSEEDDSKDESE